MLTWVLKCYQAQTEYGLFSASEEPGLDGKWYAIRVHVVREGPDPCDAERLVDGATLGEALSACERRYAELAETAAGPRSDSPDKELEAWL